MILIIGGAHQGKLAYGRKMTGYGEGDFLDGSRCGLEEIFGAKGIRHFHEYLRRCLEKNPDLDWRSLADRLWEENPNLVVITNELGYGIVPAEPFDRLWRETAGRVCTALAKRARAVHRVVCGLGMALKGSDTGCVEILLIRHGKTEGNLSKRYIGVTDESLCPQGIREIEERSYPRADVWFSSPMRRCVETARLIAGEELGESLHIVENFRECDFGAFENKNYRELADDPRYQEWIDSGGVMAFPGGESPEEFKLRSCLAFERTADQIVEMGCARANLAVHGGTIMSIMERYARPSRDYYQWHVDCGRGYRITLCPESWRRGRILAKISEIGQDKA